jgi:hypothetical protein
MGKLAGPVCFVFARREGVKKKTIDQGASSDWEFCLACLPAEGSLEK